MNPRRLATLLLAGCGSSGLPANHPCKAENVATFIAECSAKITAACASSDEECVAQEKACDDELERRCQ